MKHSARKTRLLPILLALATIFALLLVACTEATPSTDTDAPTETAGEAVESTQSPEETTAGDTDSDTATETDEETTENPADRINQPTDGAHVTFFDPARPKLSSVITGTNQATYEIFMDPTYGSVLKLTTRDGASDPFVNFNYATYMKGLKVDPVSADDYKYIVMTIRAENCSCETFELFYYAGSVQGATPGYQTTATFNAAEEGWQKIIFDLSSADWSASYNISDF